MRVRVDAAWHDKRATRFNHARANRSLQTLGNRGHLLASNQNIRAPLPVGGNDRSATNQSGVAHKDLIDE